MYDNKKRVLIIDDSVQVIRTLTSLLKSEYDVDFATSGEKGIELANNREPDIILLDIMMPDMDGYEVCKSLKTNSNTSDIPIIFVTAVSEAMDEARGFSLGAADYITKPFVAEVVLARVLHHVKLSIYLKELKRLYSLALDANPITGWPGNNSIHKHINYLIESDNCSAILYCDLDNFKSYNDNYGFGKGDEMIKATADLMKKCAKEIDVNESFFGHIGGDDFIISIDCEKAEEYVKYFISSFDKMVIGFYSEADLNKGFIESKSRKGDIDRFPIVSISIAGVCLKNEKYSSYLQISDTCAELKKDIKNMNGSNYLFDRRNH